MDISSFKSQWINYSQSLKVSYLIVLREEAHCLAATSMSSPPLCPAFPVLCLCSNAEWGFWDLPSSCWLAGLCWPVALKQVACHKGVILLSSLKSGCNNRRGKQVRHCTTGSRQLRWLPDHYPLYGRTRVGPPMLKRIYWFLLNCYCEGLEERGFVTKWEPCLALLMHSLPFTVSYGTGTWAVQD